MVTSLPEEVIEQVIIRVKCMKSILRCTSVCKSWNALIKSRQFSNIHLSHPSNKYLLCYYDEARGPFYTINQRYYAIHCDDEAFHENSKLLLLHRQLIRQVHGCNGLICFNKVDNPGYLYLWNPAINKLKVIPTSPLTHDDDTRNDQNPDYVFKLWFDTKSNDYKISKITYKGILELYSLSTNSWELIKDNAPGASPSLVCVNGILHWLAHINGNWTLISLNAETGMFQETLITWQVHTIYLKSYGDQLLCILGYGDKTNLQFCCPFLQVYDGSLIKLYTFDFEDNRTVRPMPLGFRNNGEVLFQNINDNYRLVSYSLETTETKDFVQRTSCRLRWVIPFPQTLALLNDEDATYQLNSISKLVNTRGLRRRRRS